MEHVDVDVDVEIAVVVINPSFILNSTQTMEKWMIFTKWNPWEGPILQVAWMTVRKEF